MKRVGNLYDQICSMENILNAIHFAAKHKKSRFNVQRVLADPEWHAARVRQLLLDKTFTPCPAKIMTVRDLPSGKVREIQIPRFFPDQIVHWALMLQIKPVLMRGMYAHTCGSVPGRGQAHGQRYLRRWLDRDRKGTKYCLKMDISKFYQNVNHEILKALFRRVLKDPEALWLIDTIVDSGPSGLPIGNCTSQWFANFFLQGLDHFIKQQLRVKYYVRYVDDLVLLGPNKRKLHKARQDIALYLSALQLTLKDDWQVFPIKHRFIDFLGFRFYRCHTTLRARNALRIRRRVARVARRKKISRKDACAVISYLGIVTNSDSAGYRQKYIDSQVNIKRLKEVIRNESRITDSAQTGQSRAARSRS